MYRIIIYFSKYLDTDLLAVVELEVIIELRVRDVFGVIAVYFGWGGYPKMGRSGSSSSKPLVLLQTTIWGNSETNTSSFFAKFVA